MRALLVCSSGGHLFQLFQLKPWWSRIDRAWVSFDKPDARSLLDGEDVVWAHHPTTRNIPNLLRNVVLALRVIRSRKPDLVVSNGAGVGLPFLVVAKLLRVKTVYIEVYDRQDSLTGRLARPFVDLFLVQREAQLVSYPAARVLGPILYNEEVPLPIDGSLPDPYGGRDGVFVTVGSDHHPFDRLMEWCWSLGQILDTQPKYIQHGPSPLPKGWDGMSFITYPEMIQHLRNSRVVVCHGGPATVALSLALGKRPIVIPRLSEFGEVVDDHQVAFAEHLARSGDAVVVTTLDELKMAVKEALQSQVEPVSDLAAFSATGSVARFEQLVAELLAKSRT